MKRPTGTQRNSPVGFLLVHIGAHSATGFAKRLAPIELSPPQAGILGVLQWSGGVSQQALAAALRIHPSGLVALIDDLEGRGLVSRDQKADDRRVYELHLTDKGRAVVAEIERIAREHNKSLCAALSESEREKLAEFLRRIADEQALSLQVHPGYSRVARAGRRGKGK